MKINGNFCLRKILGENILVQPETQSDVPDGIFVLDEVGTFIWEHIEQVDSVEDMAKKIVSEYEVDYETALSDARKFIADLRKNNMITD